MNTKTRLANYIIQTNEYRKKIDKNDFLIKLSKECECMCLCSCGTDEKSAPEQTSVKKKLKWGNRIGGKK